MEKRSKHTALYLEEKEICEVSSDREDASKGDEQKPRSHSRKRSGKRNKELGRRGEDAAALYLVRRGYDILERNWTCFAGEADIIARDGEALVFVEVKTRSSVEKGFPSEAVDAPKRERYEKIALAYLTEESFSDIPVRFDVVSIVVLAPDRAFIRHHINAFSAVG